MNRGTHADLKTLQEGALTKTWRPELPHWEAYIVRVREYETGDEFRGAVLFRLNHALGDGHALLQLLVSLTESAQVAALICES